jgi:hypothetical protein
MAVLTEARDCFRICAALQMEVLALRHCRAAFEAWTATPLFSNTFLFFTASSRHLNPGMFD